MHSLHYLLRYAHNYRGSLLITVISMLLLVGTQLLIPWIIKTLVGAVTNTGAAISMELVTQLALLALAVEAV